MPVLLNVENLKIYFRTYRGLVKAVDGVSCQINEREIIGLVGESGCGKSVSQLSIMKLIPTPPGEIVGGTAFFKGEDLLKMDNNGADIRSIRGRHIAMIFQEPMTSLNPVLTIARQLTEMLELHLCMNKQQSVERAIELLKLVGIPDAQKRIDDYPHQFSGGMRQRVMIAMALSCNPEILIADEPTTGLDVTTQAQILEIMRDMVACFNASLVIVTHNLGVVARYAHRIYVMYAGRVVESGNSKEIFASPRHPYTIGLLECVPRLDDSPDRRLVPIHGVPPDLINMLPTCAFLPRCRYHINKCEQEPWPPLRDLGGGHYASCYVNPQEKK